MINVRPTNYLSLDLEMNKDDKDNLTKIIQVGIAVGNIYQQDAIKTYSWFVDPKEKIHPFITDLTGITDDMVINNSTTLPEIAEQIKSIVSEFNTFVNPVQWGGGDAEMLLKEFAEAGVNVDFFGRRVIDVKTFYLFLEITNGRSPAGGLSSSMGKYKVKFEGKPHRADVDAFNTLRFFFHLIQRQATLEDVVRTIKDIKY